MTKRTSIFLAIGLIALTIGPASADGAAQAALNACADKGKGDICDFTNDKGESINGSCDFVGGVDGKLVCVPIH